jgi:hypothetical protein
MLRITQLPTSSQFTFQSNQSNSIVCQFALPYGDILPHQSKDSADTGVAVVLMYRDFSGDGDFRDIFSIAENRVKIGI